MPSGQTPGHVPEDRLARGVGQLPLLPGVVAELLSLQPDADDYFDRLVRLAARDPPFAIRVLQCANSARSAPLAPIVSLEKAATRLGTDQCAALVLAVAVAKVFIPRTDSQRSLWLHSLQTALFAKRFCEAVPDLHRHRDHAYVCGLLHDIGRFVQFEGATADFNQIDDMHWSAPQELVEAERSVLGYDHALLGWHACRKWRLPDSIGEVVRHHHDRLPATALEKLDMVGVVQWADEVSVAVIVNGQSDVAGAQSLIQYLATQHADIGPGSSPEEKAVWQRWIPGLRDESLQLARQVGVAR